MICWPYSQLDQPQPGRGRCSGTETGRDGPSFAYFAMSQPSWAGILFYFVFFFEPHFCADYLLIFSAFFPFFVVFLCFVFSAFSSVFPQFFIFFALLHLRVEGLGARSRGNYKLVRWQAALLSSCD